MDKNLFRFYNPKALISFILLSGTIVGTGVKAIGSLINGLEITSYYQFPTTAAIVLMLILFINRKLWDKKWMKWLIWIPDLRGRYEGVIDYIIDGKPERKKCVIEIKQTGTVLKIRSFFEKEGVIEKSKSKSIVESVIKDEDDSFSIVFTYQNDGISGKYQPHYGTNILELIKNDDGIFLKGNYYTDREPQTKGMMSVKQTKNITKNDY